MGFFPTEIVKTYVYCGDNNPLWMCRDAMKTETNCTYALCNGCKVVLTGTLANNSSRRKRVERNMDKDQYERECDHNIKSLSMFSDKKHFENW